MFIHEPIDIGYTDLNVTTMPGHRLYETPDGEKYPSVTTVLSRLSSKGIDLWKARVGPVEAKRVSTFAANRGTAVHELIERYLNNDPNYMDGVPLHIKANFLDVKADLDKRLTKIIAQEVALYSDHLTLAGRVDCIGVYDGVLSVIDFKTSGKWKERHFCEGYFIQETAYAIMWEERTGQPITQLVTIIAGDAGKQVFIEHRDNWSKKLLKTIEEYYIDLENRNG